MSGHQPARLSPNLYVRAHLSRAFFQCCGRRCLASRALKTQKPCPLDCCITSTVCNAGRSPSFHSHRRLVARRLAVHRGGRDDRVRLGFGQANDEYALVRILFYATLCFRIIVFVLSCNIDRAHKMDCLSHEAERIKKRFHWSHESPSVDSCVVSLL